MAMTFTLARVHIWIQAWCRHCEEGRSSLYAEELLHAHQTVKLMILTGIQLI